MAGRWRSSGWVVAGMILACLPWGLRNYRTFDAAFFVRSNFGLELRMGNHPGARAAMDVMDRLEEFRHPRTHPDEALAVQEKGEIAYMRDAGREAMDWIRAHPGSFTALTGSRVAHWWLGPLHYPPGAFLATLLTVLALVGAGVSFPGLSPPQRAGLLIPLLGFPLVYYVVAYMPRYREPVDWLFLLLAATALLSLGGLRKAAPAATAGSEDPDATHLPPSQVRAELSSS